jgi:hypothetical protein
MSDTPLTDCLARGNHVVPTEWAWELESELKAMSAEREHNAMQALAWRAVAEKLAQSLNDNARRGLSTVRDERALAEFERMKEESK